MGRCGIQPSFVITEAFPNRSKVYGLHQEQNTMCAELRSYGKWFYCWQVPGVPSCCQNFARLKKIEHFTLQFFSVALGRLFELQIFSGQNGRPRTKQHLNAQCPVAWCTPIAGWLPNHDHSFGWLGSTITQIIIVFNCSYCECLRAATQNEKLKNHGIRSMCWQLNWKNVTVTTTLDTSQWRKDEHDWDCAPVSFLTKSKLSLDCTALRRKKQS